MATAARRMCARARTARPVPVLRARRTAAIAASSAIQASGGRVQHAVAISVRAITVHLSPARNALCTRPTFVLRVMPGTTRQLRAAANPITARALMELQ